MSEDPLLLRGFDTPRHIWLPGRTDLRLGDAVGRTIVVAAGEREPEGDVHVLEIEAAGYKDVRVRSGPLGVSTGSKVRSAPASRRLDDFMTEHEDLTITRAMLTPQARWPTFIPGRRTTHWGALLAGVGAALLFAFYLGKAGVILAVVSVIISLIIPGRRQLGIRIHREGNKKPYSRGHVIERLMEIPATAPRQSLVVGAVAAPADRALAIERITQVKERYGELLTDVVYRIENSALFDPAVEPTREFTLAMATWDDQHTTLSPDEAAALSREVRLAFDTARAQAEALGLNHLPETARADADRAAKTARMAMHATTDGERAAAIEQTNRILTTLALYYLPDPAETAKALGGRPPEVER